MQYEIGIWSSYKNGWRQLWKYFWILLAIFLTYCVTSYIPTILAIFIDPYMLTFVFQLAFNIFILIPLGFGLTFAYLKAARDDSVEFNDMFEGFRNYGNAILAGVLVGIIVTAGFFLLIIPGIYLACKLAFTPYYVVDRKMAAMEAMQESWEMTKGHAWKVFFIGLLAIPICIVGFILFFIGIIPATMWIAVAFASLYHAVSTQGGASPQEAI